MPTEQFANDASTFLNGAITDSAVSFSVQNASSFPAAPFRIVVQDSGTATPEYMLVTAVAGNVFTVTRGYEGSLASSHINGAAVISTLTAGIIQTLWPSGRRVTVSGAVTMTALDDKLEIAQTTPDNPCVINLPTSPVPWRDQTVIDGNGVCNATPFVLTPPAGKTINGASSFTMNQKRMAVTFYYNESTSNFVIK